MRKPTALVCLLTSALAAIAVAAPAANAVTQHKSPHVALKFADGHVTAGVRPTLEYSTLRVTAAEKLVVQRTEGTRRIFERVKTLSAHKGSVRLPAVQMGRYEYRIVVLKGRTVKATSAGVFLYSYGTVTALQLCNRQNDAHFEDGCGEGTIQVGGNVYTYAVDDESGNTSPNQEADVAANHSSCRSVHLTFAVDNDETDVSTPGAELSQASADPQSDTGGYGSVGTLNASIRSSAWNLIFWTDDGNDIYWNGSFSCWSANGNS